MSKTYVVTGAGGFIGARLVEALIAEGAQITSVDTAESFSRPEHRDLVFGKLVAKEDFLRWFKTSTSTIDGVFHLGACSDTMELNEDYLRENNIEYSQEIWKSCTKKKIPLVYASSAATYGAGENGYDDNEAKMGELKPLNPYGNSKKLFDDWALKQESEQEACPPSWAGFKFFNVYGFGEKHKGGMASVVNHAFHQIREKGKLRLFKSFLPEIADGEQKRDFVYVGDVVSALIFAMNSPIQRGIYNLGTGNAETFLNLGNAVFSALEKESNIEFFEMPEDLKGRYQNFTEAKIDRLKSAGYDSGFHSLEEGVKETITRMSEFYSS